MLHADAHPLTGKTVRLRLRREDVTIKTGDLYVVEDWWDRVYGSSWRGAVLCAAAAQYAVRSHAAGLPGDDEVVYGTVGGFGYLVHVSELDPVYPCDSGA